jgi:hypothetical protein
MDFRILVSLKELEANPILPLTDEFKRIFKGMKDLTGRVFDNDRTLLQYNGSFANILVSRVVRMNRTDITYSLYDLSGTISIGSISFYHIEGDTLDETVLVRLKRLVTDLQNGLVKCNGCNTKVALSEGLRHSYAGFACRACYDTKYKHIKLQTN